MRQKINYLAVLASLFLIMASCDQDTVLIGEPVTGLSNDAIKRSLPIAPNLVDGVIEFAYAMAIPEDLGNLSSAQVTASIPAFQKGRLLLVQMPSKNYLLHRVERVDREHITLRGDGNLDISETCTTYDVVAEAVAVIRDGKEIRVGSMQWNLYRYLWPRNRFLRRVGLGVYRRVFL